MINEHEKLITELHDTAHRLMQIAFSLDPVLNPARVRVRLRDRKYVVRPAAIAATTAATTAAITLMPSPTLFEPLMPLPSPLNTLKAETKALRLIDLIPDAKAFGRRLTVLRCSQNLSKHDLAEKSGLCLPSLYRWENGVSRPHTYALEKLAVFYNMTIKDLVDINLTQVGKAN